MYMLLLEKCTICDGNKPDWVISAKCAEQRCIGWNLNVLLSNLNLFSDWAATLELYPDSFIFKN